MSAGWKKLGIENNSLNIDLSEDEDFDDQQETTRQIQWWYQNRLLSGLTLWPEGEEDIKNYISQNSTQ